MKCNNCGGEMEYKENEDILIPIGDDKTKSKEELGLLETDAEELMDFIKDKGLFEEFAEWKTQPKKEAIKK